MRLSMEKSLLEQMTIEQFRQNLALLKAEEIEMPKKWVLELLNTIEALQQENEQLKDENTSLRNWNACEEELHNELLESDKRRWELESELEDANNYRAGLEAIVDKLRAHVMRMSEILSTAHILLLPKQIEEVLEGAPDYHNPADVEALRKAREALYAARFDVLTKETDELASEALAAIDKAIGGKEDE